MRRTCRVAVAACASSAALVTGAAHTATPPRRRPTVPARRRMPGQVKHVIYLQFDNTHYRRDNPNVASDLEQMPHLLNFLKGNGTLLTNDHTILISHTAGGILSSLTGLYPDRNGQTVSNSYDYFRPNGTPTFTLVVQVLDRHGRRHGRLAAEHGRRRRPDDARPVADVHACRLQRRRRLGGEHRAREHLDAHAAGDMTRVFGQARRSGTRPTRTRDARADRLRRLRDPLRRRSGAVQSNARTRSPTTRPIVPGSDNGDFRPLRREVRQPGDHGSQPCVKATRTAPTSPTRSATAASPASTGRRQEHARRWSPQMQEHGVPVTYAYISDAHDNHSLGACARGPGEADYKQQLADYDTAFAAFFQRLQNDGIDKSNTLFVVTVDEGDHFAGGIGHPAAGRLARLRAHAVRTGADDVPVEPDRRDHDEPEGASRPQAARRSTCTSTTHRRSTSTASRHGTIRRCGSSSVTWRALTPSIRTRAARPCR